MKAIKLKLTGTSELVMHNGRLADPMDSATKKLAALTKKKNKSEEDHKDCAKAEFLGSLYTNKEGRPVIPTANLLKCFVLGARKWKKGKEFERSVMAKEPEIVIDYDGPKDAEGLWAAGETFYIRKTVSGNGRPGGPKIQRTRPRFPTGWTGTVTLWVDDELDVGDVLMVAESAGRRIGVCERYYPWWGRFTTEQVGKTEEVN